MRGLRQCVVAVSISILFTLGGCSLYTASKKRPLMPLPKTFFSNKVDGPQQKVPQRWWKIFEDPQLTSLVDQALKGNLDVLEALSRVRAASFLVKKERSSLFPTLDLSFEYSRSRRPGFFGEADLGNNYNMAFMAGYELDLWQKAMNALRQKEYEFEATKEDLDAARITVAARIVSSYFRISYLSRELRLHERKLGLYKKMVAILEERYRRGTSDAQGLLDAQARFRKEKVRYRAILQELEEEKNALWVLLGKYPRPDLPLSPPKAMKIPRMPQVGVPVWVINRRPDVRSAFLKVMAQDRAVAQALAQRLPTIKLSFQYGRSRSASSFGVISGIFWNAAMSVASPVFDAGKRKATYMREKALLMASLIQYQRALLRAVQEVEGVLSRNFSEEDRLNQVRLRMRDVKTKADMKETRYGRGLEDPVALINEKIASIDTEIDFENEALALVQARIDLLKAISGSWTKEEGL